MEATAHLSQELFESWRQLVETTLHAMLQDDIKRELKVAVLFELIQDLLIKVSPFGCEIVGWIFTFPSLPPSPGGTV